MKELKTSDIEIWRDIKGYEGYYKVSNTGKVKSVDRIINNGKSDYVYPGKILKNKIAKTGYCHIGLSKNMNKRSLSIHRLVAESFLDNPLNLPCVNHINGIKTDNVLTNLEWVTHRQNTIHAVKMGLKVGVKGEKNHYSKLKKEDIIQIRKLEGKLSQRKIAGLFNVTFQQISRIINRENWKHIQ